MAMAWCVRGMKSAECTTGGAGADAAPAAAVVWPSVGHDGAGAGAAVKTLVFSFCFFSWCGITDFEVYLCVFVDI